MSDFELIHGDCQKLIPTMGNDSVDIVVTDPPYGMKYNSNYYKDGNPFGEIVGDSEYPSWLIPEFKRIARKAVFSFCRWDNLAEVEKPKSFIVWAKNNWTAGDLKHEYGRMWEGILFYPCSQHSFKSREPDLFDARRIPPTQLSHPTEKPVSILKWIIENNTDKGDLVFDPFMGSGSTAIAAQEIGRQFCGIEISKDYYNVACMRLEQSQNQIGLGI